jgi:hypothetical protein
MRPNTAQKGRRSPRTTGTEGLLRISTRPSAASTDRAMPRLVKPYRHHHHAQRRANGNRAVGGDAVPGDRARGVFGADLAHAPTDGADADQALGHAQQQPRTIRITRLSAGRLCSKVAKTSARH